MKKCTMYCTHFSILHLLDQKWPNDRALKLCVSHSQHFSNENGRSLPLWIVCNILQTFSIDLVTELTIVPLAVEIEKTYENFSLFFNCFIKWKKVSFVLDMNSIYNLFDHETYKVQNECIFKIHSYLAQP